jgi:hypothetical protein
LNTSDFSKDLEELILNREKNLANVTSLTNAGKQDQDNDSKKSGEKISVNQSITTTTTPTVAPIDIKKEIAFSILNVGEVIAKTIDYYSLESNDTQSEDLKELIKLSDDQAALEKKESESKTQSKENLPTGLLHVSIDNNSNNNNNRNNVDEGYSKKEERKEQLQTPESSASSLSSPSLGGSASSPMSESGSVSPIITKSMHTNNKNDNNDDSMKVVSSPSSRHQDYDLIETVKSTAFTEQVKPSSSKNSIQDDLAYLASELSMNTQLNGIENFECSQIKNNDVINFGNEGLL